MLFSLWPRPFKQVRGLLILQTRILFRRFKKATAVLLVYFAVCVAIHASLYQPTLELAAYRAVVKSFPGKFHEPMNSDAIDHLSAQLTLLNYGGDLSSLGLGTRESALTVRLGDDRFDMQATLALLEDKRLASAKAKLELLGAKLDRIYTRRLEILKYLILIAFAGMGLILIYLLWLGFRARPRLNDEISPLSIFNNTEQPVRQSFAERLSAIVNEEVKFGQNRAQIKCTGFDAPEIKTSLMNTVEHIAENLVRNSVIHGGRKPEDRLLAGKPEFLSIRASFQVSHNVYLLTVWDNGEGIDPHVAIASALELGLISQDATRELPLGKAVQLIFLPGFSTRINVTSMPDDDLSLDKMREMARQQGGVFSIHNQPGVSCQFTVKFAKF